MDKLIKLLSRCKCGVFIIVNEHRDYYQSVQERLKELSSGDIDIPVDIKAKMIKTDTIISIQFYPDNPIGSYDIYHWDMDKALDEALQCLE